LSNWHETLPSKCLWCKKPLLGKQCPKSFFDGTNLGPADQSGLIRFSHSGCGFFKFIVVAGPLKGTIWSGNPNGDDEYLSQDKQTFIELLDNIYSGKDY
jgi:hypothetical protein